jgi:hypothetical protein
VHDYLLGGGAGIGQLDTFAYALDQAGLSLQLLVVAGRNAPLAERLRAHLDDPGWEL